MGEVQRFLVDRTPTPIGELMVVADREGRLRAAHWTEHEARLLRTLRLLYGDRGFALEPQRNPGGLTSALDAYFRGDLLAIDRLPVATGGTEFQQKVWTALRDIPCGTAWSYAALAQRIGRPSAVRAVGHANGANPVVIVLPCHRVVGSNGSLTGYGGGMERKQWLLEHEGAHKEIT